MILFEVQSTVFGTYHSLFAQTVTKVKCLYIFRPIYMILMSRSSYHFDYQLSGYDMIYGGMGAEMNYM